MMILQSDCTIKARAISMMLSQCPMSYLICFQDIPGLVSGAFWQSHFNSRNFHLLALLFVLHGLQYMISQAVRLFDFGGAWQFSMDHVGHLARARTRYASLVPRPFFAGEEKTLFVHAQIIP